MVRLFYSAAKARRPRQGAALLLAAYLLALPAAQAGVLSSLLRVTGLEALLTPSGQQRDAGLEEEVESLDAAVLALLGGGGAAAPMNLSQAQRGTLAAMDLPAEEFAALQLAAQQLPIAAYVTRQGNDQPGLAPQTTLNPRYQGGHLPPRQRRACADSDTDGVCDADDQCLKTPSRTAVMANGCHLEGPVSLHLQGVIFPPGSAELTSGAEFGLRQAAAVLKADPAMGVVIAGHTDAQGPAAANMQLSRARAQAVARYLRGQGIAARRLTVEGLGESRPLAGNDNEVGRARNRRVELRIINAASPDVKQPGER